MSNGLSNSTNKRKSDGLAGPAPKKPRKSTTAVDPHAEAKSLLTIILASPSSSAEEEDIDALHDTILKLAAYAKSLEKVAPVPKTKDELEDAADKVKKAAISGIKKKDEGDQTIVRRVLSILRSWWKASCKGGEARWCYDGICVDPDVFATVMGSDSKLTWKAKKIAKAEFEALLGERVRVSVRWASFSRLFVHFVDLAAGYDTLGFTGTNVNGKWDESEGTFKLSGMYGRSG